jgi:phosphopantothenoylcysteine decarboxylase/phosphopantothenate--cysteine ligase
MGFALASEAAALGADVTVVAANVSLARDPRVRYVDVETAAELEAACAEEFERADLLLMAAAVVDFRPSRAYDGKMKKGGDDTLELALEKTPDILAALAGRRRDDQVLVGFAAEHGDGAVAYGREKLARKGVDAIVVNDIGRPDIGFDVDANEVTIVSAAGERHVPRAPKAEIARAILTEIITLRDDLPVPAEGA